MSWPFGLQKLPLRGIFYSICYSIRHVLFILSKVFLREKVLERSSSQHVYQVHDVNQTIMRLIESGLFAYPAIAHCQSQRLLPREFFFQCCYWLVRNQLVCNYYTFLLIQIPTSNFLLKYLKGLRTIKGTGNREQGIRISTYQKLCIPQYMISDKLKFLFFIPSSFDCAQSLILTDL